MAENGNGNGVWSQRYSTIIQTITTVGLFVAGLWAGVLAPMSARIDHLADNTVTVQEQHLYKDAMDKRVSAIEAQILRLQDGVVTRNEHQEHWADTDNRINTLKDQVVDIAKQFHEVYNAGDAFKTMQKELDDLRAQIHRDSTPQPAALVPPPTR